MVWIAVLLCLLVSFVFSGIEAGILSVNRVRLAHREKAGDTAAIKLNKLLADPERLLVTVLLVTNLMNISAVILSAQEFVRLFGGRGYFITLAVFLPVYLFLIELLPKSLFRRFPFRALAALAEPLRLADLLLSPVHFIGWRITRRFFKRAPSGPQKLFVAREDFKYLTIESERKGQLTSTERALIHDVIDFRAVTASEVMIPMEKVQAIPAHIPVEELVRRAVKAGHERWPVLADHGEITGVADTFEIALEGHRHGTVGDFQRRIVKVGPHDPAHAVLRKLRAARLTMAVVVEQGKVPLGIVTDEDLIRKLVSAAGKGPE
ncbi:MAG TPA: CNNM domain-containing protein [Chthoniobacteraceae bacterium]|jgi:CBS domain containing-hemolysin-like protein|nr:CNNM domain-containing protein [Chthoniobacteraceae bacterium]